MATAMTDSGAPLRFGIDVDPRARPVAEIAAVAERAEAAGLDFLSIQDHPYQPEFLDAWTLITFLAARTQRIRLFPNVANVALRPPAMLAKEAASLDILTGGRIELAIGTGGYPDAAAGMGGRPLGGAAGVAAAQDAIQVIRRTWNDHPGPPPAHSMGIWLGAFRQQMLRLAGRYSDGWVAPANVYLPPVMVAGAQRVINDAARAAGRDPTEIRRIYNVRDAPGRHDQGGSRPGAIEAPSHWAETLAGYVTELGFDSFVMQLTDPSAEQIDLLANEVIPRVRELVSRVQTGERGGAGARDSHPSLWRARRANSSAPAAPGGRPSWSPRHLTQRPLLPPQRLGGPAPGPGSRVPR